MVLWARPSHPEVLACAFHSKMSGSVCLQKIFRLSQPRLNYLQCLILTFQRRKCDVSATFGDAFSAEMSEDRESHNTSKLKVFTPVLAAGFTGSLIDGMIPNDLNKYFLSTWVETSNQSLHVHVSNSFAR